MVNIRSIDVGYRLDLLPLNLVEKGSEDPPSFGQLVCPHEVGLLTGKDIQDQTLVSIGKVEVSISMLVCKIQFTLHRLKGHPRLFQVHLGINCLHTPKHNTSAGHIKQPYARHTSNKTVL